MFGGFDGFFHGKILVIGCQNLKSIGAVHVEADKVLENIQEALLLEDSFKEGIELSGLCILVTAVLCFPGHEAVLAGGDGARLGGGHVTHDADLIVDEQGRNLMHVVPQLAISGGSIGFLAGGRFQLHDHQWQAIDKQNDVGPLFAVLNDCPLVDGRESVVFWILVVHQIHQAGSFLALQQKFHRHAVLQIIGKDHVFLQQRSRLKVFELVHCVIQRLPGHGGINRLERRQQFILIQRRVVVPLDIRAIDIGIAQTLSKEL